MGKWVVLSDKEQHRDAVDFVPKKPSGRQKMVTKRCR